MTVTKALLRRQLLYQRKHLPIQVVNDCSRAVAYRLQTLFYELIPTDSAVVAVYYAYNGEIDLRPFVCEQSQQFPALQWALPVVAGVGQPLQFYRYEPAQSLQFTTSSFIPKLKEYVPPPGTEAVLPQIMLVPLVGFTVAGQRLGMGGGFYDHTLAYLRQHNIILKAIGVAYDFQQLSELPTESHDQSLDFIVTETRTLCL